VIKQVSGTGALQMDYTHCGLHRPFPGDSSEANSVQGELYAGIKCNDHQQC
jgi:hypothetical protein